MSGGPGEARTFHRSAGSRAVGSACALLFVAGAASAAIMGGVTPPSEPADAAPETNRSAQALVTARDPAERWKVRDADER